jgi:hypothetical protein
MIHESSEMKFVDLSFTGKSRTGQGQSRTQNGDTFEAAPEHRMLTFYLNCVGQVLKIGWLQLQCQ